MRKVILTPHGPRPRGVYSQAIVSDGFVFVAGQVAVDPLTNALELGDIKAETRRTLDNLQAILLAAGSSLREVVRIGVYLADLNDFEAMNEVFRKYFPEHPPARTTVGANLPKVKIEIDCIASLSKGRRS
jgi:2-iminobutanoate/2-iminopropanoate deaminase